MSTTNRARWSSGNQSCMEGGNKYIVFLSADIKFVLMGNLCQVVRITNNILRAAIKSKSFFIKNDEITGSCTLADVLCTSLGEGESPTDS